MKTVIDFSVLTCPGQIILSTEQLSPISIPIRGSEVGVEKGLIAGLETIVSTKIPSHSFLTYTENDLVMGMELTYPNIRKFDLSEYSSSVLGDHFTDVYLPPCLAGAEDLQQKCLAWMRDRYKEDIPYNVLGLFRFFDHDIPNSPKHEYCAQFVSLFLKFLSDETKSFFIPDEWQVGTKDWMVSPFDLQKWLNHMGWRIPKWTTQIEDSVNPQAEIIAPLDREV